MKDTQRGYTLVTDAYSPTNLGDLELVRLTVLIAIERYGDNVVVLAADPGGFLSDGAWPAGVEFRAKAVLPQHGPLRRVASVASLALASLVAALPAPVRARRSTLRVLARICNEPSLGAIADAQRLVAVGGGYLGSRYIVSSFVALTQYWLARRIRIEAETMPLSIASCGPILRCALRIAGRRVYWRAREEITRDFLHGAGLAADVVPDLAWLDAGAPADADTRRGATIAPVGSNFYSESPGEPACWPVIVELTEWLPTDEPIQLLAMHRWDERLADGRDDQACAELAGRIRALQPERAVTVVAAHSYRQVREAMAGSRIAVSERLHAALAAATTGTPCRVVAYEPKHLGVLRLAGLESMTRRSTRELASELPEQAILAAANHQRVLVANALGEGRA